MECSSNCVFEVYFSKEEAITRIGFRPGFAPKALNWRKSHENQTRALHLQNSTFAVKTPVEVHFWTRFQVWNLAALAKSPNTGALQSHCSSFLNGL